MVTVMMAIVMRTSGLFKGKVAVASLSADEKCSQNGNSGATDLLPKCWNPPH